MRTKQDFEMRQVERLEKKVKFRSAKVNVNVKSIKEPKRLLELALVADMKQYDERIKGKDNAFTVHELIKKTK
jgi:hypothetical protein